MEFTNVAEVQHAIDEINAAAAWHSLSEMLWDSRVLLLGGARPFEMVLSHNCNLIARINGRGNQGQTNLLYIGGPPFGDLPGELCFCACEASLDFRAAVATEMAYRDLPFLVYWNERYQGLSPRGRYHDWLNIFSHQVGTFPTTGMIAVRHLTLMPIRELNITGFDFWRDEDGLIPYERDQHKLWPQILWLRELVRTDHRVVIDKTLEDILLKGDFDLKSAYRPDGSNIADDWREVMEL